MLMAGSVIGPLRRTQQVDVDCVVFEVAQPHGPGGSAHRVWHRCSIRTGRARRPSP